MKGGEEMFYQVPLEEYVFGHEYVFECENEVISVEFAVRESDETGTRDLLREDIEAKINGNTLTIDIPEKYKDGKYVQLNINTIEKEKE